MTLVPDSETALSPTPTRLLLKGRPPHADHGRDLLAYLDALGATREMGYATRTWLGTLESDHSRLAYAADASWWVAYCAHGGIDMTRAHPVAADAYATELREAGLATSTRARRLAATSSWYSYLVRADVALRNPFAGMRRPVAGESTTRGLTTAELTMLLAAAKDHGARTYALMLTMATTAARVGSVLSATIGSLGSDQGHRTLDLIVKGGKRKRVVLPAVAAEAVDIYLATRTGTTADAPLFATATGRHLDESSVFRTIRRLAAAAGIAAADSVSPHSLRHTYATTLLSQGDPLADVQDAMGHADPRTTRRYDRLAGSLHRSPSLGFGATLARALERLDQSADGGAGGGVV